MARLVGLAYASKLYRNNPDLAYLDKFSVQGNEVAFGTIGNGATAEGIFFEAINAAGVLQIPMLVSIWDDAYAISVTQELQTTKIDISKMFEGFRRETDEHGIEIFRAKGWDYEELCYAYREGARLCREEHVPVLMHVYEITQPFGHSTSGSHERYKPADRLEWEVAYDCNVKFKEWILNQHIASEEELNAIELEATDKVRQARQRAWDAYLASMKDDFDSALEGLKNLAQESTNSEVIAGISEHLKKTLNPYRTDSIKAVKKALRVVYKEDLVSKASLNAWVKRTAEENKKRYNSHLYSESAEAAINVPYVPPVYNDDSAIVDGREVVQHNFEALFKKDPRIVAFGEDVGQIGDVNQGFAGLQEKFGINRVVDTGIRETTIVGQALGMAMRGLRPIAEIQYLDYLLFCIQTLSDDVATLQYRTAGGQKAPLIIRTRGHRLEGMFHAGSPMSMILGAVRGMYVLVPRNLTQAAGFYNTMLQSDDPALIIESLNAYRLKERMPANLAEFTIPLGVPETLRLGTDITIVTYGSMCRVVLDAASELQLLGVSCEVIDVQTLLPFDRHHLIVESIKKTNRVIFADEDVSGGASAFMMQKVIDEQNAYQWLDAAPRCLSAQDHRTAYSTDGDYFTKTNPEQIIDAAYAMMVDAYPDRFPKM